MVSVVNLLEKLSRRLDESESHLRLWDQTYAGERPLAFLSPEAREALGQRFRALCANYPKLVVDALAERLRVVGFTSNGEPLTSVWAAWTAASFDEGHGVAHTEALALGRSFVTVWTASDGSPSLSVESPHEVQVLRDPVTREVTAAAKRWREDGRARAILFLPDKVYSYVSSSGVPEGGAIPPEGWQLSGSVPNPLGVVPVVPFVNRGRLLDVHGVSEMREVADLSDGIAKLLHDLLVTSEFFARPRRWATGLEVQEEPVTDDQGNPVLDADNEPVTQAVNPFGRESDRVWQTESAETKFGQFPQAELSGYKDAIGLLLQSISAVSGLPAHYLGIINEAPPSADAIRSAEASLVARAFARQRMFGPSWAKVAALTAAVEDGTRPQRVEVVWANPETRTVAEEADAVSKLTAANILPVDEALARLGYSPEQIGDMRAARLRDALDRQLIATPTVLPGSAA
jgi:hypothetical protein